MKKDRFWFSVSLCVVPLMIVLSAIGPSNDDGRSGRIEGSVSIHGRPMAGGYIVFVPDDLRLRSASGTIDEKGHYAIGPNWRRNVSKSESRFRICLIPKLRRTTSWGQPQPPDWSAVSGGGANTGNPGTKTATNVASSVLRRLSDPQTSNLEVRLDSGPAQIDIAL